LEKLVEGQVAEGRAIREQRAQVKELLEHVVERWASGSGLSSWLSELRRRHWLSRRLLESNLERLSKQNGTQDILG
jgi:hypothetical protein